MFSIASAIAAFATIYTLLTGKIPPLDTRMRPVLATIGCGSFAIVLGFLAFRESFRRLRCFENAIEVTGPLGRSALPLEAIESISFAIEERPYYWKKFYRHRLVLCPVQARHLPRLTFTHWNSQREEVLEQVARVISRFIAGRMRIELDSTGRAKWTDAMAFTEEGVCVSRAEARGGLDVVPYAEIHSWEIRPDGFVAFNPAGVCIMAEPAGAPNLLPGIRLLIPREEAVAFWRAWWRDSIK